MKHRDFKNKTENSHPEQKEKSAAFAIIFIFTSSFLKTNEKKPTESPNILLKKDYFSFKDASRKNRNTTRKGDLLCNSASF